MRDFAQFPGEAVLWQGQPGWRALARSVFHVRLVVVYFALAFLWHAALDRAHGLSPAQILRDQAPLLVFAGGVCGLTLLLAWVTARTTAYAITNRRIVLRFGVALPATVSLPLRTIGSVAVQIGADHAGDIALTLRGGGKVSFVKMWPLVRPWRRRTQPMLRCVPRAGMVAALLSRTLAQAEADAMAPPRPREPARVAEPVLAASG